VQDNTGPCIRLASNKRLTIHTWRVVDIVGEVTATVLVVARRVAIWNIKTRVDNDNYDISEFPHENSGFDNILVDAA